MKIIFIILLLFPLSAICEEIKHYQKDHIGLYFYEQMITGSENRIVVDSAEQVTIKIFTNIKNIKTLEITDYYASKNLCKSKKKTLFPTRLAKFTFDPIINVNNIETRIHMLCANNMVSNPNIIRLDINITTGDNRAIHKEFTMIIKMNPGIYGTNDMDGYN